MRSNISETNLQDREKNRTSVSPAPSKHPSSRRARRWRKTPRCAHGRTPVGARRARPSRKMVEKASTQPGTRRRLESQPKFKTESEANASLSGVAVHCMYTRAPHGCLGAPTLRIGKHTPVPSHVITFKEVDIKYHLILIRTGSGHKWFREKALPSVSSQFSYQVSVSLEL